MKGVAAGAAVLGFDSATRSWVTTASAAASYDRMPPLDGVLLTDEAALAAVADDYGHIISRRPVAVLQPGSVQDIVKAVRFARKHRLQVAGRGQGHSTYGQPQVEAGVVIDMSTLSSIHAVTADYADVDAGVRWHALLDATLPQGLTPPVLTDYIELSVGGTLTVGGIGGASHRYGVQADNVLGLQVVTGEGELVMCSPTTNRDLFDSVLCGLGQFGIIVRARVRLIQAETQVRVFQLSYDDIATFTADQRTLIDDERFHYVEGQVVSPGPNTWNYMLEAASFYTPPAMPDDAALLVGLRYNAGSEVVTESSYFDFLNRIAPVEAFLRSIGVWQLPHPWFNVFVPGSNVDSYVGGIVSNLTLADTGQGPVLVYPVKTSRFTRQFFRVPDESVVFLFSMLRTAPPDPAVIQQMVDSNRELYERVRAMGGTNYLIGAIPFSKNDWRRHFSPAWGRFVSAKRRYDPDNVLTPGQGVF